MGQIKVKLAALSVQCLYNVTKLLQLFYYKLSLIIIYSKTQLWHLL